MESQIGQPPHPDLGFPKELTAEIAADNGLTVDFEAFEAEMEQQRERARAAQKVGFADAAARFHLIVKPVLFVGYDEIEHRTTVRELLLSGKSVDTVSQGQDVEVVLSETPFYGEMGGQVGDTGEIRSEKGRIAISNVIWPTPEVIVHQGTVAEGTISVNDAVEAIVDEARRLDIARNHTATHLLQAALRQVLGTQVQQAGSLVARDRLRFDFTYLGSPTRDQLAEVQRIVNERVRQNLPVRSKMASYSEAIAQGALAFFGEKYGEEVRVLEIGEPVISTELCGGTHVNSTGEIGLFLIIDEGSIGAGMRRIEAVTGRGAEELVAARLSLVEETAQELRVSAPEIKSRISALQTELDAERKRALSLERELQRHAVDSLLDKAESVAGITVLAAKVSASNMESLRHMGDLIKGRLGSVVVVLGAVYGDQANFVAMVTPDLVAKGLNAGQIAKQVAAVAGGSGGGRAELGQAGGKDKRKIDDALRLVRRLVESKG
ncbi:Alanine--tRNA ligase [subsurface metagenome]